MRLVEYPDREMMMLALANTLAGEIADFLRRDGHATLCVPGGTTPAPVFDTLSGVDLDWGRVAVVLNDERWVAEDSPRSNTRLLRSTLLKDRAAAARLVPLHDPAPEPEDRIGPLAEGLAPHLPISVLLLGMGADMHTASLFPDGDRLAEALSPQAPPLVAMRAPSAPEPRVTLTAPVLRGALSIHVLIAGADKRAALHRAQTLTPAEAPIRIVLDAATVHWAE